MLELLHPRLVHFPIALLLTSVIVDWVSHRWKREELDQVAWVTLLIGLAGAVLALIAGLIAAQAVPADSPATTTLNLHKILGIGVLIIFGLQAVCRWRNKGEYSRGKRILHTFIQIAGVALIVAVGTLGGELVYTYGIGVSTAIP